MSADSIQVTTVHILLHVVTVYDFRRHYLT